MVALAAAISPSRPAIHTTHGSLKFPRFFRTDLKNKIGALGDLWGQIAKFGGIIADAAKAYFNAAKESILALGDQLSDALSKVFKPISYRLGVCLSSSWKQGIPSSSVY